MNNINSLFQNAGDDQNLSMQAQQILNTPDLGRIVQANIGVSVDDLEGSEAFIMAMLIDDSGSIRFVKGNSQAVRDGHNLALQALEDSKSAGDILVHTKFLNGQQWPFVELSNAVRLDTGNYNPAGGTPLYDKSIEILGTIIAKVQELADSGVPARSATLIVTDGADEHSVKPASAVKVLVDDLLRQECHIVAGMGIDDGSTDFRLVFRGMGIPDEWILTPGNTPSEIRKAFQVFSRSASQASQGAAGFSAAAQQGFGGFGG